MRLGLWFYNSNWCPKNKVEGECLVPNMRHPNSHKAMAGVICKCLQRKVEGSGRTLFWWHKWVAVDALKDLYPRLFSISLQQNKCIVDVGCMGCLQLEMEFWMAATSFCMRISACAGSFAPCARVCPHCKWGWQTHLNFSAFWILLCQIVSLVGRHWYLCSNTLLNYVKGVWVELAPPRVELLAWMVLLERMNTKDRLRKFKIIDADGASCSLHNQSEESVDHLFCHCLPEWKVWSVIINWWALKWCLSCPRELFEAWIGIQPRGFQRKVWCSLFFVIVWSIWQVLEWKNF